jgi:hypothetical protein
MKCNLIFLLSFFLISFFLRGYEIGQINLTYLDEARNNRLISTEIFYPVAEEIITETFPVVIFGHGWLMNYSFYQDITDFFVPQGWIIAFPRTEEGIFPSHEDFALDLAFLGAQMQMAGENPESIFYTLVDSLSVVMGHSMGGGCAVVAATFYSFASVITFAAAETNISAIEAALAVECSSLTFSATADTITPPATNQLPIYQNLASDYKSYVSIISETHLGITSNLIALSILEGWLDYLQGSISISDYESILAGYVLEIDYEIENHLTSFYENQIISKLELKNYPNPFNPKTTFSFFLYDFCDYRFSVFDIKGRLITTFHGKGQGAQQILWNAQNVGSGIYFYQLKTGTISQSGACLLLK